MRKLLFSLLVACIVQVIFAPSGLARDIEVEVVAVIDGDTIRVTHDGQQETIRLYGIDAPEAGQAFGPDATEFVESMVLDQVVAIRFKGADDAGCSLGIAVLPEGGWTLNERLVRAGLAWCRRDQAFSPILSKLEGQAREGELGLWSAPNPVAPWEHRLKRNAAPSAVATPSESGPSGQAVGANDLDESVWTEFRASPRAHKPIKYRPAVSSRAKRFSRPKPKIHKKHGAKHPRKKSQPPPKRRYKRRR